MIKLILKYWLRFKAVLGLYRVAIYITEEALYFLEIERDFLTFKIKNIDVEWFLPDEELVAPIHRIAQRYPYIKDHAIYTNIAEKSTISGFFSIPRMPSKELNKGLPLEVSRHLPYNQETMEMSFQKLGDDTQQIKVLAVIAKRNKINEICQGFRRAGLLIRRISISNYSFINAIRNPGTQASAYLYPEPSSCTINLYNNKILDFSYTSYAKNLINQLKDIDRALAQYHRARNIQRRLSVLRFIGDFSAFPEVAKGRFLKYFITIEKETQYIFPSQSVEKFFVELPAMVGIGLQRKIALNLIPKKDAEESHRFLIKRYLWAGAICFHFLLLIVSLYSYLNLSIMNLQEDIFFYKSANAAGAISFPSGYAPSSLAAIATRGVEVREAATVDDKKKIYQEQIRYVENLVLRVNDLQEQLAIYQQQHANRTTIAYFLYHVAESIPEGIKVEKTQVLANGDFTLEGNAENQELVNEFMKQIIAISPQISIHKVDISQGAETIVYRVQGKW